MVAYTGIAAIAGWSSALEELHRRIAHRFARSEARERVGRYLSGLLQRVERKPGTRIAGGGRLPKRSARRTLKASSGCSTRLDGTPMGCVMTCGGM